MKTTLGLVTLCISFTFSANSLAANAQNQQKVNSATLHIDGEHETQDTELLNIQNELKNVRGLKTGYKRKARIFQKLTHESEELKENLESYMDNRVDYEAAIGEYNRRMACLEKGDASKCIKNLKKKAPKRQAPQRRQRPVSQREVQDYVGSSMAVPLRKSSNRDIQNFIRNVDMRIAQRDRQLISCYKEGGFSQEGVLKVQMKISSNGNLGHLGFEDTTQVNDQRVIRCLSKVLYSINYPATPDGRTKTIRKPFIFNLM